MRKVVFLLALSVLTMGFLVGCKQEQNNEPEVMVEEPDDDQYGHIGKTTIDDLEERTVRHDGLTDESLPGLKELIRGSLRENDFLDWGQFEKVSEIREFKDQESVGEFSDSTAFYPMGSNMVVICPRFFGIEDSEKVYSLIHEMIHSLVGPGKVGKEESMHLFMEGITDVFTVAVTEANGLEYNMTYWNESYCIVWLTSLYGDKEIARVICNGDILTFIDEKAGEAGCGAKLHNCLTKIDKSSDKKEVKEAILTEIEILQKVSGSNVEVSEKNTEIFEQAYAEYLE